jgi:hypothetical protein
VVVETDVVVVVLGAVVVVTPVVVVIGAVVVVTEVVVVVLGAVVVVTEVVVVVFGGDVGWVVGAVVVLVVVGAAVVAVVVGAVVVVVVIGAAVVVVTEAVELDGMLADVGGAVVGVELVLGHPPPCPQVADDELVGGACVVVVKAHGLAPPVPEHAVVVLPGAVGRDVFVVPDVLLAVVAVVVPGLAVEVLVVWLVVVVVLVVLPVLLVVVVVLVVLAVLPVVVVVLATGSTAEPAVAFVGSPRYTHDTTTIGDGHPTGQVNFTGKSAAAVCGAVAVQPFLAADLAVTRQSVPAGWPVPA